MINPSYSCSFVFSQPPTLFSVPYSQRLQNTTTLSSSTTPDSNLQDSAICSTNAPSILDPFQEKSMKKLKLGSAHIPLHKPKGTCLMNKNAPIKPPNAPPPNPRVGASFPPPDRIASQSISVLQPLPSKASKGDSKLNIYGKNSPYLRQELVAT